MWNRCYGNWKRACTGAFRARCSRCSRKALLSLMRSMASLAVSKPGSRHRRNCMRVKKRGGACVNSKALMPAHVSILALSRKAERSSQAGQPIYKRSAFRLILQQASKSVKASANDATGSLLCFNPIRCLTCNRIPDRLGRLTLLSALLRWRGMIGLPSRGIHNTDCAGSKGFANGWMIEA